MPFQFENFVGRPWHHSSKIYPSHLTLNSRTGRVIFVATNAFHGDCPLDAEISVPYLRGPSRKPSSVESEKTVLIFDEEACGFESLVGGKGSSLAVLKSNAKTFPTPCNVPTGLCVTVYAWKMQTAKNAVLQAAFQLLKDVATGVQEGRLEESCNQAKNLLSSTPVDAKILTDIREALKVNRWQAGYFY